MSLRKTKVIIIEPSVVIQLGLKSILNTSTEFELGHCFTCMADFQETALNYRPGLFIINPQILYSIKNHHINSLRSLFSEHSEAVFVALLYHYFPQELVSTFHASIDIFEERQTTLRKLKQSVQTKPPVSSPEENSDLSDRELEILKSIAKGLMNKEIADEYSISIHTVMTHRKNIIRKTGIKTVSGLTMYALFNNLITPSDIE